MIKRSLAQRSLGACRHATEAAKGTPSWNSAFVSALRAIGFDVIPVSADTYLGVDGPIWAPRPADGGDAYAYPSVIAPSGWSPGGEKEAEAESIQDAEAKKDAG